jgi:hypothetical protein
MYQAVIANPFVRKLTEAVVATGLLFVLLTGLYDHVVASGVPPSWRRLSFWTRSSVVGSPSRSASLRLS